MRGLYEELVSCADKTVSFFERKLQEDGSLGDGVVDICCYFKAPMMFFLANKPGLARRILAYAKEKFLCENGDFMSTRDTKSTNGAYQEFWAYANGWFVRAANQLGFEPITEPAGKYLDQFSQASGGFLTHNPSTKDGVTDILTAAHLGLINLEKGNLSRAEPAGEYLCRAVKAQPSLREGLFLRFNADGQIITDFPSEAAALHIVKKAEAGQLYFMIGYPIAYLGLLYKATNKSEYLEGAKAYLNFALSCHEDIFSSGFSHKIAWGASILYSITEDPSYLKAIERIVQHFISTQTEQGIWYADEVNNAYDQSAEIACWLIAIKENIGLVLEKKSKASAAPASLLYTSRDGGDGGQPASQKADFTQ